MPVSPTNFILVGPNVHKYVKFFLGMVHEIVLGCVGTSMQVPVLSPLILQLF